MKQIFSIVVVSTALLFSGCLSSGTAKRKGLEPVPYAVKERSNLFNEKNIAFSIDSLDKQLYIKLTIKSLKNFPFPVNTKYKDTLCKTAFRFDFYNNNKDIPSEYPALLNTMEWQQDTTERAGFLSISTDTIDLRTTNELKVRIPLYAFHALKSGKQTIELRMGQTVFTNEKRFLKSDGSSEFVHICECKELLNARVTFDINVPVIYKSMIYGEGLVLKNDSTFSAAGMDNTIWKSSYPDIYWTLFFPKDHYYAQTNFETSTDKYVGKDTFNLYHYSSNDTIGFGVYDHDNLSRDDGLGAWYGGLGGISKNKSRHLSFGNVAHFDFRIRQLGKIN
ncbi:MAG: hypothetical protein M3R27_04595 [Bacteroidota bacterium]|nr:hypothetical protein [Bacteroidota bacterium]